MEDKKTVYAISLGDFAEDYELDDMGNILVFGDYDQIANYCLDNDINFEIVNIHEMEIVTEENDND